MSGHTPVRAISERVRAARSAAGVGAPNARPQGRDGSSPTPLAADQLSCLALWAATISCWTFGGTGS